MSWWPWVLVGAATGLGLFECVLTIRNWVLTIRIYRARRKDKKPQVRHDG